MRFRLFVSFVYYTIKSFFCKDLFFSPFVKNMTVYDIAAYAMDKGVRA